jgi:hypothetical protein
MVLVIESGSCPSMKKKILVLLGYSEQLSTNSTDYVLLGGKECKHATYI